MAELLAPQQSSLNPVPQEAGQPPETGQLDPRFVLWRKFCTDQGIAIDSLSSELDAEAKEQWEKLKESELGSK